MISTTSISVIAAAFLFGKTALAANATTVSATGCVDPSSMNSCLQSVDDQLSKCVDEAGGNDEELIGCQWEEWLQQMVCYQASCWNKAYSCEYQYLVTEYKSQRTVDESIPFYPAPDNAPGGCSCSLGQVYANFTANLNQLNNCQQYTTTVSDDLTICECCGYSAASSAFYGICPNTSPDGLGFFQSGSQYESVAGSCAGLTADVCANYGFYSADNGTFLDPINLPGGTEPLSTTAGPSSLTTPPAGATITWSALSQVFTVTAAPYNAKNVASGGTAAGTATAAATATATRTGTAAGMTGSSGSETSATGTAAGVTSGGSQTTATGAAKTGAASSIRKGHNSWAIIGMLSVGGLMAML